MFNERRAKSQAPFPNLSIEYMNIEHISPFRKENEEEESKRNIDLCLY